MKSAILIIKSNPVKIEYFEKASNGITKYRSLKEEILKKGDDLGLELWTSNQGISRKLKGKPRFATETLEENLEEPETTEGEDLEPEEDEEIDNETEITPKKRGRKPNKK